MKNYCWSDVESAINECKLGPNGNFDNCDIVIFGAGNAGMITLKELNRKKINVVAFCDNDADKYGEKIGLIKCISPNELKLLNDPIILVTPLLHYQSISKQLEKLKIRHLFADAFPIIMAKEKYKFIFDNYLYDEKSKHVFVAMLLGKLKGSYKYSSEVFEESFYYAIPSFKFMNVEDIIIDCGAFVGDTIQELVERRNKSSFKKIYAFEPGDRQFEALNFRVDRLKKEWALLEDQIICVKAGVGEKTEKAYLNIDSETPLINAYISDESIESTQNNIVDIISLDDFFGTVEEKITFIKADIEGFELEMFKGATEIIKKYKPNLAFSLYHKWDDFFVLPEYIKSIVPEYNISIRHHGPLYSETVCYCSILEF
ncbi:FkbM family methyltransferase [Fusibacter sp. 3D3]|uniref:FkbM family methyltransferase n=1 Tax=Fusibacter sp. 3D3 TaxID=1048380 RepID=UPI000852E0EA|nr:FkbM family methyltransferase [Fusibacter sp. 3D3]GAU75661.1 methyltransferase [Fusibacter sp. 3D3]